MKIIFWGNGNRGESCLEAVHRAGFDIGLVVLHPSKTAPSSLMKKTQALGLQYITPENPNEGSIVRELKAIQADVFVLAGYGKIIGEHVIDLPKKLALNLHAGKLPEFRGSSPLNWALIKDESSATLSIIKVDPGVDTGDVLIEKKLSIGDQTTILDLHEQANQYFPQMLLAVLQKLKKGNVRPIRKQHRDKGAYYPLRFPEDGFVVWDMYSYRQVHNIIRALTDPYPRAFTYHKGRRVDLLASEFHERKFFGEPGRVYQKNERGLLVCASDQSLWITKAVYHDNGASALGDIQRYDTLSTVRGMVMKFEEKFGGK